jgi:PAS domain S-box-containing protein
MILTELANNIALFVALAVMHNFISRKYSLDRIPGQILMGILYSFFVVIVMNNPLHFTEGVIFDCRSIILSITGLFGGPLPAVMAAITAASFRISQGGGGALMGVLVIISSSAIGVLYFYLRRKRPNMVNNINLLLFGFIVHAVMVLLMFTLPKNVIWNALSNIALPVIILFPIGTLLVGRLYLEFEYRKHAEDALRENEDRFRTIFENSIDAIGVSLKGTHVIVNQAYLELFGYRTNEELAGKSILNLIAPDEHEKIIDYVQKRAAGLPLPPVYETKGLRKNNIEFEMEVKASSYNHNDQTYTLVILRDISMRKQSEIDLSESEKRFRLAAQLAYDLIYEWKVGATDHVEWFGDIDEMLGYEPGEFPRDIAGMFNQIHPEDKDRVIAAVNEHLKTGDLYSDEYRLRKKDGDYLDILSYGSVLKDSSGNILKWIGTNADITERKKQKEQLEFQSLLLNNIYDRITATDLEGNIIYVNDAVLHMLGKTREEVIGISVDEFGSDPSQGATQKEITEKTLANDKWQGRVVNYTSDGQKVLMDARTQLIYGQDGLPKAMVGISTDITERMQAEEALVISENQYRLTINSLINSLHVIDRNYEIVLANESLFSWLRKNGINKQIIGMKLFDAFPFIPDEDRQKYEEIFATGEVITDSLAMKFGEKEYHVETKRIPIREGNTVSQIITIIRDVTTEKKLEQQLQQAQKMEAIGTLAGGIAHDFNNILTGILGHASLLKLRNDPASKTYSAANTIEQAAERAAELTAQLLGFARKGKHRITPVDIHKVIPEAVSLLSRTIDKNIKVRQHLDSQNPIIKGDPAQIQQALLNLAINARDVMPDGGELSFQTEIAELDDEYCQNHLGAHPGRYLLISVTDTGEGIPQEYINRIFEPFFTTKKEGKGTGMGLAMVYGIVKNHDGYITVNSEVGQGTTFKIYLPLEETETTQLKADKDEATFTGSGRILIVDDEEIVRTIASRMLLAMGYEVIIADNGIEAVEIYKKESNDIDLVIIDMIMPEMGGHKCFIELKKINPNIKAILSTGFGIDGKAQAILDEGVLAFVQKPYRVSQLGMVVTEVLNSKS